MNVLKALHCTIVSMLSVETLMAALSVIVYLVTINHYHQEEAFVKVYCHTMHNNIMSLSVPIIMQILTSVHIHGHLVRMQFA